MTMAEKKLESIKKEITKATASLERYTNSYNKKNELCIKLGCDWTDEEYRARQQALRDRHKGEAIIPLGNDDDIITVKQNGTWFDRELLKSNIEDAQERLDNAFRRLEKAEAEFAKVESRIEEDKEIAEKELSWLSSMAKKEEEYYIWLEQFKAECAEDGILIDRADSYAIAGSTVNGKKFYMCINDGWTTRSDHSYSLKINGATYFTSGLFSTGYRYLKKN